MTSSRFAARGAPPRYASELGVAARLATRALVREPRVWPRLGLAGPADNGSHRDLSYPLLVRSARALEPYFADTERLGAAAGSWCPGTDEAAFHSWRRRGLHAEAEMLAATRGVNTHKGSIFLLGLLVHGFARARAHHGGPVSIAEVLAVAARGARPAMARELARPRRGPSQTYGEWGALRHGLRGIRGEVHDGFPRLRSVLARRRLPMGEARLHFLHLAQDTNLLHRGGTEGLAGARRGAGRVLEVGGLRTRAGVRMAHHLERWMVAKHLSPAAAGDLTAALLFLRLLVKEGLAR